MDEFSYLSVLISVILGLAVTQILKGFRGILLSRARVRIYWPVIAWAAFLLLICSQNWWSMFGMRNRHDWTFLQFTMVLLNTVFIYMMTAVLFPMHYGQFVDQLLAFGRKLNVAPAPVSFNCFAGDEFSFRQAVDNVD